MKKIVTYILHNSKWMTIGEAHCHIVQTALKVKGFIYFFSTGEVSKINEVIHSMQRNPFFMPSGFTPQEKINIAENKPTAKRVNDETRERKRGEKKLLKLAKIQDKRKHPKNHAKSFHIQHGRDLAKEWGYDGFDRTYHPTLTKVN